jgi:hypothetical protein
MARISPGRLDEKRGSARKENKQHADADADAVRTGAHKAVNATDPLD